MITITKKRNCCGCGACANACPVSCIEMKADEEGFLYPHVNTAACVGCGKCEKTCPILNHKHEKLPYPAAYAAVNLVDETRRDSSSGGVFSLLAEYILQRGGVVIGAAWDVDFSVIHLCIESEENIRLLRGSKYPQSNMGNSFSRTKQFLEDGRLVLFTGTPCHVNALLNYLNKPYPNLFTQDLICHGTPSPAVWQAYIKYRSDLASSKIAEASLRKKLEGKKVTSVRLLFEDGGEYVKTPHGKDEFMKLFLYSKCLRPSCHHCKFKGLRQSDITLADFWGVNSVALELNDGKGVSLVLTNTPKGEAIFEAVKDNLKVKKVGFKRSLRKNPSYFHSTAVHPARGKFMKDFRSKPFDEVLKRHSRLL